MASAIIHLAIAKKISEKTNIPNIKDYYLGTIAPDISKQMGENKEQSHFLINTHNNIPNINIFKKRYPTYKYNSFDLGYFIHLYTDKIWKEEFIPKLAKSNALHLPNGTVIKATEEEINNMIYADYTNINKKIAEKYNLNLAIFQEEFNKPTTMIREIPIDSLDILINKMRILIENSKQETKYTLDMNLIENFIEETSSKIIKDLKEY